MPRGYTTIFIRNSVELEVLNTHKCENIKKFSILQVFFLLINLKMPTIVGIFTFMSRKNLCSTELSIKKKVL